MGSATREDTFQNLYNHTCLHLFHSPFFGVNVLFPNKPVNIPCSPSMPTKHYFGIDPLQNIMGFFHICIYRNILVHEFGWLQERVGAVHGSHGDQQLLVSIEV